MTPNETDRQIVERVLQAPLRELQLKQLRGGLVASSVTHARARYQRASAKPGCQSFVIKALNGAASREAAVHERLSLCGLGPLAPRLWAVHRDHANECRLYMEAIRPIRRWPWRELPHIQQVLQALARLHTGDPADWAGLLADWDYETDVVASAGRSLETFDRVCRGHRCGLQRFGSSLRRLADGIGIMRRWLLDSVPFGRTVIHGDVHPGNVMIRIRAGRTVPVLLDWGRARLGSPLEDVSSWLQSLGYWEPQAKRRHDTLMAGYLASREITMPPGREFRRAYWIAAASNVLAGALSVHLQRLASEADAARRTAAWCAARDALRIIRRADALWRS